MRASRDCKRASPPPCADASTSGRHRLPAHFDQDNRKQTGETRIKHQASSSTRTMHRGGSAYVGSSSLVPRGGSGSSAINMVSRGRPAPWVPGVRRAFNMTAVEGGSSELSVKVNSTGYLGALQKALSRVGVYPNEAIIFGFDVDETIAHPPGTGNRVPLPDHVLKDIKQIHVANNRIFVMVATGRTPADAQVCSAISRFLSLPKMEAGFGIPTGRLKRSSFRPRGSFTNWQTRSPKKRHPKSWTLFGCRNSRRRSGCRFHAVVRRLQLPTSIWKSSRIWPRNAGENWPFTPIFTRSELRLLRRTALRHRRRESSK